MTCYECSEQPLPAGMTFADRSAVGVCQSCGRGLCRSHGRFDASANAFRCAPCAEAAKKPGRKPGNH